MAAYGYVRVSTAKQASEGDSLEVQRREVEGYAHMKGFALDDVIVEEGVSGSVPLADRPAGGPLIAKLAKGDVVIAAKLDRMFRSALDTLQTVQSLKARGVKLHVLDIGGDVSGNGVSGLFLTILSAVAQFERERIAERIGAAKADQKARKRFLGGHKPFGYRVTDEGELIEDPAEQAAIKRMVALRKRKKTLFEIKAALAVNGVQLSHEAIRKLIAERENALERGVRVTSSAGREAASDRRRVRELWAKGHPVEAPPPRRGT
jgi:putative DNA-invertase from lambdoid prophage Rac